MKIVKALNNNMVLVRDDDDRECICQGKGIGFKKRPGDQVDEALIERRYMPESEIDSRHFQQLFQEIEDAYWQIAEEVVEYAKSRYGIKASPRIILPLCDHMSGAVQRYKDDIRLDNPMLFDVKRVYPKEFQIGKYALELLKKEYGVEMDEGEAAFLAYHFVNAQLGSAKAAPTEEMTKFIGEVLSLVEQSFQIRLNEEDWNYQRFLTHLKFFANRLFAREIYDDAGDEELYVEMQEKHPHVHRCVERLADYILIHYHYDISSEERLYLFIHISRVLRAARQTDA